MTCICKTNFIVGIDSVFSAQELFVDKTRYTCRVTELSAAKIWRNCSC